MNVGHLYSNMEKLTRIERIRLTEQDVINLSKLGGRKSKFIRDAIREKIERLINIIIFVPLTRYETYKKSYHSALPKAYKR